MGREEYEFQVRIGKLMRGKVCPDKAWRGGLRLGEVLLGTVWLGLPRFADVRWSPVR